MNWIFVHQLYIVFALFVFFILGFAMLIHRIFSLNKKVSRLLGELGQNEEDGSHQIMRRIIATEEKIGQIEPRLEHVESIGAASVQKVGFLRFNPFQDTGGDNSFALALLDKANNGVLISSLYMREGIRVYGKRVENGKTRYPLLDEEKKALQEATRESV